MKKIFAIILASMGLAVAWPQTSIKTVYQCPMKCEGEKTYDMPGKCPVCGMNLQQLKNNSTTIFRQSAPLKIVGAMKNVMMQGQLQGIIYLDSISNREHLYGFGPVEYLRGEVMILDGKSYISSVGGNGEIRIKESYEVKAPFFAYQNIEKWDELNFPDTIETMQQLENFLKDQSGKYPGPFLFRVTGTVKKAKIHVVNLPKGTVVSGPSDAHIGQKDLEIINEWVELLGFFSTEHKAIFTHHDTFLHIHLITDDKKTAGHLDEVSLKKGTIKLYIPRR